MDSLLPDPIFCLLVGILLGGILVHQVRRAIKHRAQQQAGEEPQRAER